jgi:hypothetical protein
MDARFLTFFEDESKVIVNSRGFVEDISQMYQLQTADIVRVYALVQELP